MDVETMREFIQRWRAVASLRDLWLSLNMNPAIKDLIFPPGMQPSDVWRGGGPWDDEDHAIAAGVAAVWP